MPHISELAPELIAQILGHLDPDHENINIDRRGYVKSEVSLMEAGLPVDLSEGSRAVGNFRRTCRKFAQDGARHMFKSLVIRFSKTEFQRLENIARSPQLAKEVRKLTYKVTRFFLEDRDRIEDYLRTTDPLNHRPSFRQFVMKLREQRTITATGIDVQVLREALDAFSCLQHVQLLRTQTDLDEDFVNHLRRNTSAAERYISYEWMPAMDHAAQALAQAVLESQAMLRSEMPLSRLSTLLDPESAVNLVQISEEATSIIAGHLESLVMRFPPTSSPNQMQLLETTLRDVFALSSNMLFLHIGFPQYPVKLSIQEIFSKAHMEKLRWLSIDRWRLGGEEIISIVRQYKRTLWGLRLRGVLLEGDDNRQWKDVLVVIRKETNLKWVSLRRINYASIWEEMTTGPHGPAINVTDQDDDDNLSESSIETGGRWGQDAEETDNEDNHNEDEEEEYSDEDDYDDSDTEGSDGGDNSVADSTAGSDHEAIPRRVRYEAPQPWERLCSCSSDEESLGDSGEFVEKAQWKYWERWVLGRKFCAVHGQRHPR